MNKLTTEPELTGKTIRRAFEVKNRVVLVFEDHDWCVIDRDDEEAALCGRFHTADIKDYLDPDQLVDADLLTPEQAAYLKAQNAQRLAAANRARAKHLLAEAEKIAPSAEAEALS